MHPNIAHMNICSLRCYYKTCNRAFYGLLYSTIDQIDKPHHNIASTIFGLYHNHVVHAQFLFCYTFHFSIYCPHIQELKTKFHLHVIWDCILLTRTSAMNKRISNHQKINLHIGYCSLDWVSSKFPLQCPSTHFLDRFDSHFPQQSGQVDQEVQGVKPTIYSLTIRKYSDVPKK